MMILWDLFLWMLLVAIVVFSVRIVLFKTGLIYMVKKWRRIILDCFHVYQLYKVPEFNENLQENNLYRKVYSYLNSLSSIEDSDLTNLLTGKNSNDIILRLNRNQVVNDEFLGARVCWINESSNFLLKIRKSDKRRILGSYLRHIQTVSDEIHQINTELKLFMNDHEGRWRSIPFNHPCTFENIAMETDLMNKVKSDLESFLKGKQYYNRLGRVWKRSYLLYGPSGTGKSSFVAAMANYLDYHVYDLDLSKVENDSDLKMLLLQTRVLRRKNFTAIPNMPLFDYIKRLRQVISGFYLFRYLLSFLEDFASMMRPLYVGNIEYDTRQKDLERLFRDYGKIEQIDMKSGYAFVYFENERDAEDAIRGINNMHFGYYVQRKLIVEWAKGEREKSRKDQSPNRTLFVGNLDPIHTKKHHVERIFEPYGKVLSVRMRHDHAFVHFATQKDATKAFDCTQNTNILDRVVLVEYAWKKETYVTRRKRSRSSPEYDSYKGPASNVKSRRRSPSYI